MHVEKSYPPYNKVKLELFYKNFNSAIGKETRIEVLCPSEEPLTHM